MKIMAEETEQRMCDEDLEGEEADQESYLGDNSGELLDRLKELEAENSALMLANENQREAYERCLDEVANHVVQALLNQKDLREECIKLKMLVFDLERQNRALCELFQQKLPNHPTAHYQCQAGSIPEFNPQLHNHSSKQVEAGQTEAQAKGNGHPTQHAFPGPRGSAASMEALSPFFKKKAHILEVLRKMEETDPLKFHPSAGSLSLCDFSQVLMSTEAVLASAESQHTHCHCSRPDADAHPRLNGDGAARCLHCKKSSLPPQPCSHVCSPSSSHGATASGEFQRGAAEPSAPSNTNETHKQATDPPVVPPVPKSSLQIPVKPEEPPGVPEELTGFCPSSTPPDGVQTSHCDASASDGALYSPPERDQDMSCVRAGASVSPSPSCDVKAVAVNSPSKLLKFLKIPSMGDKSQAASPAPRLSPQLTRNSRIPCRTNNYEVYHSPVPTRRATTTERCRQPPPPPTRSESYPATHSAPTSPPKTEDICPAPAQEISLSPPKISSKMVPPLSPMSEKVPHYENVETREPAQVLEKATPVSSQSKGGDRKLIKSLPESVLKRSLPQKHSSSSASQSSSDEDDEDDDEDDDDDEDEESDSQVWVNQHSLPSKPQSGVIRRRQEVETSQQQQQPQPQQPPPPPPRRTESSSIPKRPALGPARPPPDSSHHAFKDRLAALGKLRSSEDLQSGLRLAEAEGESVKSGDDPIKTADRPLQKDGPDGKPKAFKCPPVLVKQEGSGIKMESPKSRIGLPSPNADTPQVLRNNIKSLNLAYNVKVASYGSNSPNKIPPKSPSKPCPGPAVHRTTKPPEAQRYASKSEERTKIGGKSKKNPTYGDSLPSPPPKPPSAEAEKQQPPATSPHSAIEQKVMKGIEENMLKLQEQDRGAPVTEVKQKASNGIASWFGLKKSKLPALSKKSDAAKREWKINIPSVGRDSVKVASRCKEGVEGLNISTLMEKAEGLRRALEEERAYVERSGRGHSCEVVMDQSQGQLAVMYRGAHSDNFMQQLLNRVDGKEVINLPQRRLSFDYKTSKPVFNQQSMIHTTSRDEMGAERVGKVTSEENMADASQRFAGSGASTYTLDSGIGTFPLPDCSGATGRGLSRTNHCSPGRAGRRARTLDREPTPHDECFNTPHKYLIPTIQYSSMLDARGSPAVIHEHKDIHGNNMFSPRSKTWTFPNLEAPAGPAEVYLAVEEEEPVAFGSPFRASLKPGGTPSSRPAEPGSLPVPTHSVMSRRGKNRTPSVPEVSRETGLELLRERPEEALSPSRPQVLETPESLSDSLYDSLSSCGSQG